MNRHHLVLAFSLQLTNYFHTLGIIIVHNNNKIFTLSHTPQTWTNMIRITRENGFISSARERKICHAKFAGFARRRRKLRKDYYKHEVRCKMCKECRLALLLRTGAWRITTSHLAETDIRALNIHTELFMTCMLTSSFPINLNWLSPTRSSAEKTAYSLTGSRIYFNLHAKFCREELAAKNEDLEQESSLVVWFWTFRTPTK